LGAAFGAATLIIVAIIFSPSFLVSTETYISFFRSAKGASFSAFWIFVFVGSEGQGLLLLLHLALNDS